uniref:Uncharacterized protein n=1 Tax=Ralstonia solanacearum TaxID=305 RepID=A0A0S4V9E4_RALSL|nr:protein of unknown function [Ralstonia solanacearum]CUV31266.1 protein of unknown function [Ralstonia solanacearum]
MTCQHESRERFSNSDPWITNYFCIRNHLFSTLPFSALVRIFVRTMIAHT